MKLKSIAAPWEGLHETVLYPVGTPLLFGLFFGAQQRNVGAILERSARRQHENVLGNRGVKTNRLVLRQTDGSERSVPILKGEGYEMAARSDDVDVDSDSDGRDGDVDA